MLDDTRYFLQAVLMVVGALLPIVDPLVGAARPHRTGIED
jgi:hypothetical protein